MKSTLLMIFNSNFAHKFSQDKRDLRSMSQNKLLGQEHVITYIS